MISLRRDVKHLSILLALTTLIGLYLAVSTVLIASDGVVFIELAQALQSKPIATMRDSDQHPGYPFLVLAAYVLSSLVYKSASVLRWIYCAQSVTFVCRFLSIPIIYLIGRRLIGRRRSFWAVLILLFLPDAAEYGSDALSDWPHLLFLMGGFLLLLSCAANKKRWPYGFIGVLAGVGYLIRPECVQLIIYSFMWEIFRFLRLDRKEKRRAVLALALLVACFALTAGPYMKLKGAVFPKKKIGQFTKHLEENAINEKQTGFSPASICGAGYGASDIVRSLTTLTERLGQNFLWYFLPFSFLGILRCLRKAGWRKPEYFLPATFIVVNVFLMVWIWCNSGYMSRRHVLPLTILLSVSIPPGVGLAASKIRQSFARHHRQGHAPMRSRRFWFGIICLFGIALCLPKLLTPTRAEKRAYREAAEWLRINTDRQDQIILLETRIGFYAERKRLVGFTKNYFDKAKFLVQVVKSTDDTLAYKKFKEVRRWESGGTAVVVYATTDRLLQSEGTGLVAYWPMDDNTATTTVVESVIGCDGNSKRNTNLITIDGVRNGALLFDGLSDFVDIGFEYVFSDDQWSVSIWFKSKKTEALQNFVSSDGRSPLQWFGLHSSRLAMWDIEGAIWRHGNTFIENDVWNHVVLTYDGCGNYQFFLNGVPDGDKMNLGTKHDTGVLRYIGVYRDTKTRHFSGALEEIKIFGRAMTLPEVQELYEEAMFSPKTKMR